MRELSEDFTLLEKYDAKAGLPELWIGENKAIYNLEDIFIAVEKVGIRKNYEGKADDKAFYMQTFRKFKELDFSFAFLVKCETKIEPNNLVFVGGERQSFKMEVRAVNKGFQVDKKLYQASKNAHKVILTSDAYLKDITQDTCGFAITETVGFRCLQANEKTTSYYNIRKKQSKEEYNKTNLHKSEQIELYKKGSVFYFSDEEDMNRFANQLKNSEFYTIGYNHFVTIKKQ